MKHMEKLENFWQFRLTKIIWTLIILVIWVYGTIGIWTYFSFNPYKTYLEKSPSRSFLWEIYDFDEHYHKVKYAQNYGVISEKSAQFEFWKYPKMLLAFFILTGSLILATILAYRMLIYIIFWKEKTTIKSEDQTEIIEAEIVKE